MGVGDRLLARIEESGAGYTAFPMKVLAKTEEFILGIQRKDEIVARCANSGSIWNSNDLARR